MKHSTRPPTKAQKLRLESIKQMPCIACEGQVMDQPFPTELHHIVDKGYRIHSGGHDATIPLCSYHHRGELLYPLTSREMDFLYGPSFARRKRAFIDIYGTERELLERTNEQLQRRAA